jgi:imidazolonepropionase-like amidohydrolase
MLGFYRTGKLLVGLFCCISLLQAQETTFKTNGPDNFSEGLHAFINATIFKDYQTQLQNATLLIRNGKVENVGTSVALPAGAIVHDMKGKFIYPSFIDLYTDYGMPETQRPKRNEFPQLESNVKGAYGWNQAIHTDFHGVSKFNVHAAQAEEWRKAGFGTVLTNAKDGIARGTGVLVTLANDRENNVVILPKASAHYSFNKGTSTQDYPSSTMGVIALLRQTYLDAQWYKQAVDKKEYNINLEEWNTQQNLPQIFDAGGDWLHILRADKIGDEFGVQYTIKTKGDEYQRIAEVAKTKAVLIVPLNFPKAYDVEDPYKAGWVSLEEMKHWELAPANAATLQKAGIDFSFTAADLDKKEDFLDALRKAVKYGLDSVIALKALTFNPAVLLKAYDKVGSLENGKLANFFITSYPLFSDKATVNENWVQGKKYEGKPFAPKDIRGEYALQGAFDQKLKIMRVYDLILTGDAAAPKAQIKLDDTTKLDVKLSYKDNDIILSFSPDKKTPNAKIRLTGSINHADATWHGDGQLADGSWIKWKAKQIKSAELDTVKQKTDSTDFTKDLGKIVYPFMAYGTEELPKAENYLLKNGEVWTSEKVGVLQNSDVLIRQGKIAAVGKNLTCSDCQTIDASGKYITSGIIDEHSHIAIRGGVNEGTEASSAEVRIGDVVTSEDINIYRQLAGGVTAAQLLHGSANPIGGQSAIVKLKWGYTPEQMKVEGADGFIKFALGENVKQSNWGDHSHVRYPQTRMGVEQTYYNYFTKAREYEQQWKSATTTAKGKQTGVSLPRKDIELDALVEILNGKRFITCHSYVQSEINMLMHVADSFGFKVNTFTHILEGYKVADKMKTHGANASTFADWWAYKYEVIDAIPQNAAILTRMGITTAINSDDAEMARRLNQEAAKSVKYAGMNEEEAWKMVTINPAKMLHLDSRMGSIKSGKDADIVMWSDNPLSIYARAEKTFVEGILFFDIEKDAQQREQNKTERARLTQKMLDNKKAGSATQEPSPKGNHTYSCGNADHHH